MSHAISQVSEELSSVETTLQFYHYSISHYRFQKNLVVWKRDEKSGAIQEIKYSFRRTQQCGNSSESAFDISHEHRFQKNLVVWKRVGNVCNWCMEARFQKNLVVWKQISNPDISSSQFRVSEELSSVETGICIESWQKKKIGFRRTQQCGNKPQTFIYG